MNSDEVLNWVDRLVREQTEESLSSVQTAVIRGVLDGMTYKEIQETDPAARGYTVGYLARYIAYHLWQLLTEVFQKAGVLEEGERVRSKNLWECVTRSMEPNIPASRPRDLMLGKLLRLRYRITEHLVSSEWSHTYLVEDEDVPDRLLCVVKQLKSQSQETIDRFKREAKVLRRLGKHDRIPELLASFEENGQFYIVHEFIEGQPLSHELLEDRPWQEAEVVTLLLNILEVLEFVHQEGIVHRDIHPDNLIRRASDGKIVLIDFGAVKEICLSQNKLGQTTSRKSRPGTSFYYMPPEQAYGLPKLCSDIYAIGMIAIQAVTGLHPRKLGIDRSNGNPRWRKKTHVCPQFAEILDRMVCYDFNQRYSSAAEVREAIQGL